jgi:hypothetical protein
MCVKLAYFGWHHGGGWFRLWPLIPLFWLFIFSCASVSSSARRLVARRLGPVVRALPERAGDLG